MDSGTLNLEQDDCSLNSSFAVQFYLVLGVFVTLLAI